MSSGVLLLSVSGERAFSDLMCWRLVAVVMSSRTVRVRVLMGWLLQGNRQRSNDVNLTSPPSGTVKWEGEGNYAACSQQCCEQVVSCGTVHPQAVSARWQHYWLWLAVFPFYNSARHCIPIYALSSPIGLHCQPEASKWCDLMHPTKP